MAMYALTWMLDVLKDAGLRVTEIDGWRSEGHGNVSDIRGVLMHHTAGPATGNYPSQNVVVNGRPGLDGPLCNLGLARDGTWIMVAAGLAYHAGAGHVDWCGTDNGNNHLIGIEAESTGRGDWTPAQLEVYPQGVAALLAHLGLDFSRAIGHKEWAPGRKNDPAGWPGDMDGFRTSVRQCLEGDDMFTERDRIRLENIEEKQLHMTLGKEGRWQDGVGQTGEGDPDSGARWLRVQLENITGALTDLQKSQAEQSAAITKQSAAIQRLEQR